MATEPTGASARDERLHEVLASYLEAARAGQPPARRQRLQPVEDQVNARRQDGHLRWNFTALLDGINAGIRHAAGMAATFNQPVVSLADSLKLGVNGVCLGGDRVLTSAESKDLNERLRALGLTVYDPELAAFTLGGGGAHCLMQAIRRERVA